jgi:hypothetical protein
MVERALARRDFHPIARSRYQGAVDRSLQTKPCVLPRRISGDDRAASILLRESAGDIGILIDGVEGWLASGLPLEAAEVR